MLVLASHIAENEWIIWLNIIFNALEFVLLCVVMWVLVHWAKRMVEFTDLMNEVTLEERKLRSRLEEWDGLMGNEE